jgi:stage II sporulation protein D (peptidoglycan lytic transglycosylase)
MELTILKRVIAILCFVAALPGTAGKAALLQPEIVRVALLKGAESARIGGNGVLAVDENGEALNVGFPLLVKRSKSGLTVNGRPLRTLKASAPASIQVNGKGYRGIIEISPADKGLLIVDELPLEDYLVGLINCEISSQWPIEAIKSQAVIARSYALYQMEVRKNAPYHLESSVMDQVYDGCDIEDSRAARGVRETAGEVLTFDGRVIQAFYHSNCGGHTEAAENVWGFPLPYLQGVDCKYCLTSGKGKWEQSISLNKIESLLKSGGYQISGLKDIKPGQRNKSGRLNEVILVSSRGSLMIPAVIFRKTIGYSVIKSTNFEVRVTGDEALFSGAGYGHGVGLCQWGAKQRAEDGFDYQEILSYYYPGTKLEKIHSDQ